MDEIASKIQKKIQLTHSPCLTKFRLYFNRRGEISEQIYNFINGEFIPPLAGAFAETLNPSTGEALCKYPLSNILDVQKAVEAAKSAQKQWSKMSTVLSPDINCLHLTLYRTSNRAFSLT